MKNKHDPLKRVMRLRMVLRMCQWELKQERELELKGKKNENTQKLS